MDALPSEIVISVMKASNHLSDLMALTSTCKRFNGILKKHTDILDAVARPLFEGFDKALAVVRATRIVKDAYHRGDLPPKPFPFHELRRQHARANFEEFAKTADLLDLMHWVEVLYWQPWKDTKIPAQATLQKNFTHSMLQALLAGAALARDYAEPFYEAANNQSSAPAGAASILMKLHQGKFSDEVLEPEYKELLTRRDCRGLKWAITKYDILTEAEAVYLEQFTVFNVNPSEESEENTFGPVADFLFGSERMNVRQHRPACCPITAEVANQNRHNPAWAPFVRAVDAATKVGRVTFAFIHLLRLIPSRYIFRPINWIPLEEGRCAPISLRVPTKPVELVVLGNFNVHSVTCRIGNVSPLPSHSRSYFGADSFVKTSACPRGINTHGYVLQLLNVLQLKMGRPNLTNGLPNTPAALQLFTYTLRSRLGMQHNEVLKARSGNKPWETYLQRYLIFAEEFNITVAHYEFYAAPKTRGYAAQWPANRGTT